MIVDVIVIAVLLVSALISFLRGVIREILTIAGVVGGSVAAYFGGPVFSPFMREWVASFGESGAVEATAEAGAKGAEAAAEAGKLFGVLPYDVVGDVMAYGMVFIVVVGALSVLSHFLAEAAKSIGLGPVDRTLGFVFGLARGVLLLGLVYWPISLVITDDALKEQWFGDSKTHFYLEKTSQVIAGVFPQSALDEASRGIEAVSEADKTRRKLEEINLLKGSGAPKAGAGAETPSQEGMRSAEPDAAPSTGAPSTPSKDGYTEEFRDQMDHLFKGGDDKQKLNQ